MAIDKAIDSTAFDSKLKSVVDANVWEPGVYGWTKEG